MPTPISVDIRPADCASLADYAAIPIAYEVRAAVRVPEIGVPSRPLPRRRVSPPYTKDYDAIPGNHPRDWPTRFAIERARCLGAYLADRRVGAAVVIVEPNDVASLGGDPQLALLWDLRVRPECRGQGIGRELLAAAEETARACGARGFAVETQDVNVAACQLYAVAGYAISEIEATAYPALPHEARLLWTKSFALPSSAG